MTADWEDIENEAVGRAGLKIRKNDIAIPFDDGDMPVIVHQKTSDGDIILHDIFTGCSRGARYDQGVEYIRKLRLLPTPTSAGIRPSDRQSHVGVYLKTDILGKYSPSVYLCADYMFICDRECFRIVRLGDAVEVCGRRFPYSAEAVAAIDSKRFGHAPLKMEEVD